MHENIATIELTCPNDGIKFKKINFYTESGAKLDAHQCMDCGGVFFKDWHALYDPQTGYGGNDPNLDKFQNVTVTAQAVRQCPRDRKLMRALIDDQLPKNLQIERCDICGGLWLNFGKEKTLRKGLRAISWLRKRRSEYGGLMGDFLLTRLARFVSAPTVDYFNFLPVTPEDFSDFHGSIPNPGTLTIVDSLTQKLFGIKSLNFKRKFTERVIKRK